jgi:hypothetical protein
VALLREGEDGMKWVIDSQMPDVKPVKETDLSTKDELMKRVIIQYGDDFIETHIWKYDIFDTEEAALIVFGIRLERALKDVEKRLKILKEKKND